MRSAMKSMTARASVPDFTAPASVPDLSGGRLWLDKSVETASWLETVMLRERRDGQASYTNAKCDKVNVKLDSPQSESDRGESQLNVGRAACWLHVFLPSHWIDEKR